MLHKEYMMQHRRTCCIGIIWCNTGGYVALGIYDATQEDMLHRDYMTQHRRTCCIRNIWCNTGGHAAKVTYYATQEDMLHWDYMMQHNTYIYIYIYIYIRPHAPRICSPVLVTTSRLRQIKWKEYKEKLQKWFQRSETITANNGSRIWNSLASYKGDLEGNLLRCSNIWTDSTMLVQ